MSFTTALAAKATILTMGVATGGDAEHVAPRFEIPGMPPQKSWFLKEIFGIVAKTF